MVELSSRSRVSWFALGLGAAVLISGLTACGGGGSSPAPSPAPVAPTPPAAPPPPPPPPPPPVDPLTPQASVAAEAATTTFGIDNAQDVGGDGGDGGAGGDAGDGAAIKRARVIVTDRTGQQRVGQTNDNGSYFIRFPSTFQAPIITRVITPAGVVYASASNEAPAPNKVLRLNVNPFTDKIVSDSIPATVQGTDKRFIGSDVDAAKLVTATNDLVASVRSALGVAGITVTTAFDPVKSVYRYDGNGVDAVLESIVHTRNPNTGATELRAKLAGVQNDANGAPVVTLVSSASPLATSQVAVATNPALTFAKVTAWVNHVNSCLAANPTTVPSAACTDATGRIYRATNYLHNSRDFDEDFRTLLSNSDRSHIQGSLLRNPVILGFTRSTGSSFDDVAVVEVTIRQPGTGPLDGSRTTPVEYTKILVFRRDDTLTQALAGNWILQGNLRAFDASVSTRLVRRDQANPSMQADATGQSPSRLEARVQLNFQRFRFNASTRSYADASVRAIRVKGPGLPAAGLVMTPSAVPGSTWMAIHNKTGSVPTSTTVTAISDNSIALNWASLNGGALQIAWPGTALNFNDSPITDFGALGMFARYSVEVFSSTNTSSSVPDSTFTFSNLGETPAPGVLARLPMHDLTPSLGVVTAPAPAVAASAGSGLTVRWVNNSNAPPVREARVFAQSASSVIDQGAGVDNFFVIGSQLTAQFVATPFGVPALRSNVGADFRQLSVWTRPGRANVEHRLVWSNPGISNPANFNVVASTLTPLVGQAVSFDVTGTTTVGLSNGVVVPTVRQWSVNGSVMATGSSFSTAFPSPGSYTVTMRLLDASDQSPPGGRDEFWQRVISVNAPVSLAVTQQIPFGVAAPSATVNYSAGVVGATANSRVFLVAEAYSSISGYTRTFATYTPTSVTAQSLTFAVTFPSAAVSVKAHVCPGSTFDLALCPYMGQLASDGTAATAPVLTQATASLTSVPRGATVSVSLRFTGFVYPEMMSLEAGGSLSGPFSHWSTFFDGLEPSFLGTGTYGFQLRPLATAPTGTKYFRICHRGTPTVCTTAIGPVFAVSP